MRIFFLIALIGLFAGNVKGQVSFLPVDSKLKKSSNDLIFSNSKTTVKFPLRRKFVVMPQNHFVEIDSQIIQIMSLKFDGYKRSIDGKNFDNQKVLLAAYAEYELGYFSELGVEVINPDNQWVVANSKGWFIWYFKVGELPTQVNTKSQIQLFSTTIIGDNILIINAPILAGGDFSKAALIVNELMEGMSIIK